MAGTEGLLTLLPHHQRQREGARMLQPGGMCPLGARLAWPRAHAASAATPHAGAIRSAEETANSVASLLKIKMVG